MTHKEPITDFLQKLASFYDQHGRKFPWRNSKLSNYQILITEVLLRRTTSSKVAELWRDFFRKYPVWEKLAQSDKKELETILFPLGLQKQRAEQLHALANLIVNECGGKTPIEYHSLKSLPGVGEYTINSYLLQIGKPNRFPFDINVERVLSRYYGTLVRGGEPLNDVFSIMSSSGLYKKVFYGILDLAATICKAYKPVCQECVLSQTCWFSKNKTNLKILDHYDYDSVLIFATSPIQLRNLLRETQLKINCAETKIEEVPCLIYVRKPINSIVAKGLLRNTKDNYCILIILERLPTNIKIKDIRYFSEGFYPKKGLNWFSPANAFNLIVQKIINSLKKTSEESL